MLPVLVRVSEARREEGMQTELSALGIDTNMEGAPSRWDEHYARNEFVASERLQSKVAQLVLRLKVRLRLLGIQRVEADLVVPLVPRQLLAQIQVLEGRQILPQHNANTSNVTLVGTSCAEAEACVLLEACGAVKRVPTSSYICETAKAGGNFRCCCVADGTAGGSRCHSSCCCATCSARWRRNRSMSLQTLVNHTCHHHKCALDPHSHRGLRPSRDLTRANNGHQQTYPQYVTMIVNPCGRVRQNVRIT